MRDLYGFAAKEKPVKQPSELPIQPFYMSKLMTELARESVGLLLPTRPFEDQIRWGYTEGSIRVRLTPNQGVSIERLTSDLEGSPLWVVKHLLKIKTEEFVDHEDVVAKEIAEIAKELAYAPIDAAQKDYNKLYDLTKEVSKSLKSVHDHFVYEEIKKVSENNYNIKLALTGAGVGRIAATGRRASRLSPYGIVDISYDPERGSIKGIVSTIDIAEEGGDWEIGLPYFLGQFSPMQSMEEISRVLSAGLKFI